MSSPGRPPFRPAVVDRSKTWTSGTGGTVPLVPPVHSVDLAQIYGNLGAPTPLMPESTLLAEAMVLYVCQPEVCFFIQAQNPLHPCVIELY